MLNPLDDGDAGKDTENPVRLSAIKGVLDGNQKSGCIFFIIAIASFFLYLFSMGKLKIHGKVISELSKHNVL